MEKKITKRDNFESILNILEDMNQHDLAAVMAHEIDLLDKKSASAKASAAKAKAADPLTDAVFAALTSEPSLIADIAARVEAEDVTVSKVTYRLSKLVEAGEAVKTEIAVAGSAGGKSRRLSAYALA